VSDEQTKTVKPEDACKDCGLCCMAVTTPPFICPPTFELWGLDKWICSPRRAYADEQPCVWLDRITGKCTHYEDRPDICMDYEVGCESCVALRREAGLPEIEIPT
jgi:Fe-S-cluster containining protein